jgi:hypothetical protein
MKRYIFSLCLLCGLFPAALAQTGIIGINTLNPQGVLHIDGASTPATTNPATGSVTPAQAIDDVIVDASGQVGVGLIPSTIKLDINGGIRIQDGSEGDGNLLLSDGNGVGRWGPMASGSWLAALYDGDSLGYSTTTGLVRPFEHYADSVILPRNRGSVSKINGTIVVPQTGKYRVTLSIYWIADGSNSRIAPYTTQAILYVNGTDPRATFNFWGGHLNYGVLPTFINILEFNVGDVLTIATDERDTSDDISNSIVRRANSAQAVLFMVELLL